MEGRQRPYSFPILTEHELINCLNEVQINVTREDLQRPTSEFVRTTYGYFVEVFLGVSREELQQPQFQALRDIQFPELHADSLPNLTFFRSLTKLMHASGVMDFSARDLVSPEPRQTIRNLSAIINFAKFREERLERYGEAARRTEELVEQRATLENEYRETVQQADLFKTQREKESEEARTIEKENEMLSAQLHTLHGRFTQGQNEKNLLKQKMADLNLRLGNNNFILVTARQETTKLKSQVVHSPEKLRKALTDMEASIESERAGTVEAEGKSRELQARYETLHKIEKDVQEAMTMQKELQEEWEKGKTIRQQVKAEKSSQEKLHEATRDLTHQEQLLRLQISSLEENIANQQKKHDTKRETVLQAVASAHNEYASLERDMGIAQAKLAETEKKTHEIETAIARMQKNHEREMQAVARGQAALEKQVCAYHEMLHQEMRIPM